MKTSQVTHAKLTTLSRIVITTADAAENILLNNRELNIIVYFEL